MNSTVSVFSNLHWDTLNLSHIVVKNGLLAAIIPLNGYASPILFSDRALIGGRLAPTNAVASFEKSGLVAGHLNRVHPSGLRSISLEAEVLSRLDP
jgi:hypothetical protein